MRVLLFLVISSIGGATEYDVRTLHPQCRAFQRPFDQGTCASCCAAAVATQLSLRRCINFPNSQDTLYSAQHIWDCAASQASGACGAGVMLDSMINAIGNGVGMVDVGCTSALRGEPNITRCFTGCNGSLVGGAEQYHLYYVGVTEYASLLAARALMNQITNNGPTVAVISFRSVVDFENFASPSFLRGGRVFMPSANAAPGFLARHCVVVLGWGVDERSGQNFWLIQNSYGSQWADGGFARVLRGTDLLEGDWRGLFFVDEVAATNTSQSPTLAVVFSGIPSSDIVVITFLCALVLAGLVVCVWRLTCRFVKFDGQTANF